ncbi:hypothetical protein CEXT_370541 [Caerostris extrusa]|uniref:Uncharacterized protein n=1 Tax=Caerostris extrusa TaxID=172846 RepID=A0AAV4Y0C2_CAEEX|nr:hypothetical protein CEXT_370541 [Caerostris extrusa]
MLTQHPKSASCLRHPDRFYDAQSAGTARNLRGFNVTPLPGRSNDRSECHISFGNSHSLSLSFRTPVSKTLTLGGG